MQVRVHHVTSKMEFLETETDNSEDYCIIHSVELNGEVVQFMLDFEQYEKDLRIYKEQRFEFDFLTEEQQELLNECLEITDTGDFYDESVKVSERVQLTIKNFYEGVKKEGFEFGDNDINDLKNVSEDAKLLISHGKYLNDLVILHKILTEHSK